MIVFVITQLDVFGPGTTREFRRHAWPREYDQVRRSIDLAYNLASTRIEVIENGIRRTVWEPAR